MYFYPGDLITWREHFPRSQERIGLILEYSVGLFTEEISCKILLDDGKIQEYVPITGTLRKIGNVR
jgi:hypothetical protein